MLENCDTERVELDLSPVVRRSLPDSLETIGRFDADERFQCF